MFSTYLSQTPLSGYGFSVRTLSEAPVRTVAGTLAVPGPGGSVAAGTSITSVDLACQELEGIMSQPNQFTQTDLTLAKAQVEFLQTKKGTLPTSRHAETDAQQAFVVTRLDLCNPSSPLRQPCLPSVPPAWRASSLACLCR